jgi:hypothetical protein
MQQQHHVLFDPKGQFLPGDHINAEQASELTARHGQSIPINPELRQRNAVCGLYERRFGVGLGLWPQPTKLASLLLYISAGNQDSGHPTLHWRARLAPIEATEFYDGTLRLVGDAGQFGIQLSQFTAQASAVAHVRDLGQPDAVGGWNVGGEVPLNFTMGGYLGLQAYGGGQNLKLLHIAVSQT